MIDHEYSSPAEKAKPIRMCSSLMDRWEVGGLVVPEIFLPIVESVRRYDLNASNRENFTEVLRSASVFFDGVESGLIWGELVTQLASSLGSESFSLKQRVEKLALVDFVITHFNVREEEMLVMHIPIVTLALLAMIRETDFEALERTSENSDSSFSTSRLAVRIAIQLAGLIPERAFKSPSLEGQGKINVHQQRALTISNNEILQSIRRFYVQDQGNLEASKSPFTAPDVSALLLRESCYLISDALSSPLDTELDTKVHVLGTLVTKCTKEHPVDVSSIFAALQETLSRPVLNFSTFGSCASVVTCLFSQTHLSTDQVSVLIPPLTRVAWKFLSPSNPKYHVESVRCLWQLQNVLPPSNHQIEASLASLMIENDISGSFAIRDAEPGRRFAILWTHTMQDYGSAIDRRPSLSGDYKTRPRDSKTNEYDIMLTRPLLLILDSLVDERTELSVFVRGWLQNLYGIEKYVCFVYNISLHTDAYFALQHVLHFTQEASSLQFLMHPAARYRKRGCGRVLSSR
jgi:hypothetical protein